MLSSQPVPHLGSRIPNLQSQTPNLSTSSPAPKAKSLPFPSPGGLCQQATLGQTVSHEPIFAEKKFIPGPPESIPSKNEFIPDEHESILVGPESITGENESMIESHEFIPDELESILGGPESITDDNEFIIEGHEFIPGVNKSTSGKSKSLFRPSRAGSRRPWGTLSRPGASLFPCLLD